MSKDELSVILDRMDKIQGVVNRIDRDLNHDRHDIQELTLRLGAVEGIIDQLKSDLNRLPGKVADKVDVAVQPAVDLKNAIDEKKSFKIEIKRPFWRWWK